MSKVFIGLTMTLDGYVARRDISAEYPFGKGGDPIHDWMFDLRTGADEKILADLKRRTGAVISGYTTYKVGIEGGWAGENPYEVPLFVIARAVPEQVPEGITIVTDGTESALRQARSAAGDRDVCIMGGAKIVQEYLKAGLVDEVHIHIAPLLFGDGIRLFEDTGDEVVRLEPGQMVQTPGATHLVYRVLK